MPDTTPGSLDAWPSLQVPAAGSVALPQRQSRRPAPMW
jgi:hypothetical protein